MRHKFSEEKLHPKEAVPKNIVEAGNWHWDALKKDHNDGDSLMGNVDYDWAELEAWSLHFARQYGTPQKWWRMDFETGVIYHSTDSDVSIPLRKGQFVIFNPDNTAHQSDNMSAEPRDAIMMIVKRNAWIDSIINNTKPCVIDVKKLQELAA